jgi:Amt family ammonium transporter
VLKLILFVPTFFVSILAGFALLEAGAVGSKDIISILLKNFTDFAISAITYWLVGSGFHYGWTPFIGAGKDEDWFSTDDPSMMAKILQSTMFCATAVTIVSGAIACRFSFHAYMILCVIFSGFIYPVTAGWVWGHGFLSPTGLGAIDFAGSGVVHLQGATIAMTACLFVGPRLGRFVSDPVTGKLTPSPDFSGNSIVLTALGTLILWFGWFES